MFYCRNKTVLWILYPKLSSVVSRKLLDMFAKCSMSHARTHTHRVRRGKGKCVKCKTGMQRTPIFD